MQSRKDQQDKPMDFRGYDKATLGDRFSKNFSDQNDVIISNKMSYFTFFFKLSFLTLSLVLIIKPQA